MREVVTRLRATLEAQGEVAYCRLVETRGSTPQKAGAMMLVFPDGSQAGTLGGGCVEAEVKRRALAVLAEGEAEVARFQLDNDYGWDDGLICGGRMQILIEPLRQASSSDYFQTLAAQVELGLGVTEVIAYDGEASGLPAPVSYLLDREGRLLGSLHTDPGEEFPERLRELLQPLTDRPRPYGKRGVAFLPTLPRCRLVIVGGGHIGKAVAELAADVDFDVWVVDDRAEIVSDERFPRAERRIAGTIDEVLPQLEITSNTYCLIVTRGHNHDEQALYHLADRGARYVGLIGSRRKIRMIFQDLLDEGVTREALKGVYAPLGIDIGSQTVPEIAVSICAELVALRNRGIVPGRPSPIEVEPGAADDDSPPESGEPSCSGQISE